MQLCAEFSNLLFDILVLGALLLQLLFHLVQRLHHVFLLLGLCVTFTLLLLKLLLQLVVFCEGRSLSELKSHLFIKLFRMLTHLFSFSLPALSTVWPHFHWPACGEKDEPDKQQHLHKGSVQFEWSLPSTWLSDQHQTQTVLHSSAKMFMCQCVRGGNWRAYIRTTFFTLKFSSGVTSGSWPLSFCRTICWTIRSNSSQYCTVFPLLLSGERDVDRQRHKFLISVWLWWNKKEWCVNAFSKSTRTPS